MCRTDIEPARKPNLEQLTANVAADLIQAEERDIDIHRRIALIGAFSDPRGRSDMILSLCREFAFGVSHSIAGWQGTDDQTYHASWVDYEYNNYDDDDDETEDGDDEDDRSTNDGNDDGNDDGTDGDDDDDNDNDNRNDNGDTEKRDEDNPPPSWDEVFPATPATAESATRSAIQQIMYFQRRASQSATQSTTTATTTATTATSQLTSQTSSIRALMHNVISGVVSYTLFYTFYYTLPNLVSSLVDTVVQNIRQE
jgi:hypothetical protein